MLTVIKYEFIKHSKSRRLLATVVLIIPITLVAIFLIEWGGALELVDFTEDYLMSLTLMIAMLGVFYGSDAISSEFSQKTGYVTLTSPVGRGWMLLGKFIAGLVVIIAIIAILFIMGAIYMLHTYGAVPAGIIGSFLLSILFGCAVLALSFFFSAVIPGDVLPVMFSFFLFIIIMPLIESLLIGAHTDPWYLLTYPRKLIALVSLDPVPSRVVPTIGGPIYVYPELAVGIIVMFAYAMGTLLLSIYIFGRREMR